MIVSPAYLVWLTPKDEHRRLVLRRGRQDHLLRAGRQVLLRARRVEEQPGRFDDDVGADLAPLQLAGSLTAVRRILRPLTTSVLPSTAISP